MIFERKSKPGEDTRVYLCYPSEADQVVNWASGRTGWRVRTKHRSTVPGYSGSGSYTEVTLPGPTDAVSMLPPAGGIVAAWGVNAAWQTGVPLGLENAPIAEQKALLSELERTQEMFDS